MVMTAHNPAHSGIRGRDADTRGGAGGRLVTTDGRALPLTHAGLAAEAGGGVARVTLEQRFRNPYTEPLHVRYVLPLPDDGAVSGFAFRIGEQRIEGEVDRKVAARRRFEQALATGRTAAIIEQLRGSVFDQEVGNIPPGTEVVVEVSVDQPLSWRPEGAWQWRFPTVVGPRYVGAGDRVPDAGALATEVSATPLRPRMTVALTIADPLTGSPDSTSHPIATRDAGALTEVSFAGDGAVRLDRDVVVQWPVAALDPGVAISVARPSSDGHGGAAYGLITLVPPQVGGRMAPVARDLIFLIDTSGSMGGRPLDQAKRVVAAMIDGLGSRDRLEMIEFSMRARRWKREPVAMTRDGRATALTWLRKLRAGGGTEMGDAVIEALRPLRADAQRQVVLITDGYIGFEEEVIGSILRTMPASCRLHTLGVGSSVNRSLTRPAARAGGGVEIVVDLDEDAERAARRLLDRTDAPLVTELSVRGSAVRDTAPRQCPDLYARAPALMSVSLDPAGGQLIVSGKTATAPFEHTIDVPAATLGAGNPAVTALFGRERVQDLETSRAGGDDVAGVDQAIEAAGLKFQIATRKTSWIAIRAEATVAPGTPLRTETMPAEVPYGTSIEGLGLRAVTSTPAGRAAPMRMRMPRPAAPARARRVDAFLGGAGAGSPGAYDGIAEDGSTEDELPELLEDERTGGFAWKSEDRAVLSESLSMPVFDEADEDFDQALDDEAPTGALLPPAAEMAPAPEEPGEEMQTGDLAPRREAYGEGASPAAFARASRLLIEDDAPPPTAERPELDATQIASPPSASLVQVESVEASRRRWVVLIVLLLMALLAGLAIWYPVDSASRAPAQNERSVDD